MNKFYSEFNTNILSVSKYLKAIKLFLIAFLFKKNIKLKFLFTFLLLIVLQTNGFGQNTWNGTTNTAWNTGTNWSLGHAPTSTEDVVIPNVTNKPSITVAGAVCKTLTINNVGATANALTITSPGTLTVTGAVVINNNATADFNTTIAVGTGSLTAPSIAMNDSGNDLRGCILSISSGTVNLSGDVTMAGSAIRNQVIFSGAGSLNLGGTMVGGGLTPSTGTVNYNNLGVQTVATYPYFNLTISGSGIKTLAANTTVSGPLNVKANTTLALGSFTLGNPTNMSLESSTVTGSKITGTGALTLAAGTTTVSVVGTDTSGASIACPIVLVGSRTFAVGECGAAIDLSVSGAISGAFNITKNGLGTMNLSGANAYTKLTTVSAGTLQLGNVAALGTSSGTTVSSGAVLDLNGITLSTARPLSLNGVGLTASPAGALTNNGGNASYSGAITLKSNSTITTTASGTLTCSGTVKGAFGLTLDGAGVGTMSGTISTLTSLNKNGLGTWTLSGSNSYPGSSAINAGTLKLGANGTTSYTPLGAVTNGTTVASGAVLDLNGFSLGTVEPLTLNGTGISSNGALINSSATAAIYKGLISLGSASSIISNSGIVTISNVGTITGATFGLTLGGTSNGFISSNIGNTTGGLTKINSGTWTLSGANTYTGLTSVNAGTISLGNAEVLYGNLAIANGATVLTNNKALTFQGDFTNSGTFTAGSSTITIANNANQNIAGFTTSGIVSVTKPSGVATLTGAVSANNFSIPAGPFLNLGTGLIHNTNTLNLGATLASIGSWGSTTSTATNTNNTYFGADTGKITVASSSCTVGNWTGTTSTDWNTASNWCGGVPIATTNVVIPFGVPMPIIAVGTTAVCNSLTVNPGASLSLGNGASTLNINGDFVNNGTFTAPAASTTNFVGGTQNVGGATYGILNFSGTGTKTVAGAIMGTGAVTINSGATLATANFTVTFQDSFTNSGILTAGDSDIYIAGTATNQNIAGFTTTGDVFMVKTTGTANFTSAVSGGSLIINGSGGTLNLGAFNHAFSGDWTMTAGTLTASNTLSIVGNITTTGGTFTPSTSTILLNGDDQSIGLLKFNNLTFSGTGTKTFVNNTIITNNLSIVSGVTAELSIGKTHTANSLTLGGITTPSGSWGSSSSTATNKSDTYFEPDTGIITVATTSCTAGYWTGLTNTDWNTASNWCSGVPIATTNVVIPAGVANMPIIGTATTALANNITINSLATLTLVNDATSYLNISGNFTNNGTFTAPALSTTNFVGTAQTVAGVSYGNLILSGSGTKTLGAISVTSSLTLSGTASATTTANLAIGGNLVVGTGTTFTTGNNFTLGVTGTTGITGTLALGGTGVKTYTGTVTINSGGNWNNIANSNVILKGGIVNNGTFTSGSGIYTFNSNAQSLSGNLTIANAVVTGIALTNTGNLYVSTALSGTGSLTNALPSATTFVIQGTCSIATLDNKATAIIDFGSGAITSAVFTNTGTLNLNGSGTINTITNNTGGTINLSNSGTITTLNNATATSFLNINAIPVPVITTFTANVAGNIVNYNGSGSQSINSTIYSNIILSGSGLKTLGGPVTTGGYLTLNNNTSLNMSTYLLTLNDNLVNTGSGTITGTTGGVTIAGTATQSIAGFTTTGTVSITKTAGVATLVGAINGSGLTLNGTGGTFNLGTSLTHTFTGNWTRTAGDLVGGSSTLKIAGDISGTGGTFTAGTGTLEFNRAGTQNLGTAALTYTNLMVSGSGIKTLGAAVTTNGNLTVSSGATLATANNALTFGGNFTKGGTFTAGSSAITITGSSTQSIDGFTTTGAVSVTKTGGMATFAGVVNGGNFTVPSGPYLNLGIGLLHNATGILTLTGYSVGIPAGSWGGTTSGATNINSTYFATATGKLNVATSTCTDFSTVVPITNVSLAAINNTSTATTSYEDFKAISTNVTAGQYYTLSVKANTGSQVEYYSAFIDWNNDGDYQDTNEYLQIGTIANSSGADERLASVYFQVPVAVSGTVNMRIIGRIGGYNTTFCSTSGSSGQIEDYTVIINSSCSGTPVPGNTIATANPVCPNIPFTLSLQNTIADGATYKWQTSANGTTGWTDAVVPTTSFLNLDFTTPQPINTTTGNFTTKGDDAVISGGELILTDIVLPGHYGDFFINQSPGINYTPFTASFDYKITDGGGADGMSLSYASGLSANQGGGENGEGTGIIVSLDTYDNDGGSGSRVKIYYANTTIFTSALNAPFNLRTATSKNVILAVDANGYLSLSIGGTSIASNLFLSGYVVADKSAWKFKFSARTGGLVDKHIVDNFIVKYVDTDNSKSTYTTSQTTDTYYRCVVTCGTSVNSNVLKVAMSSAAIVTQPVVQAATCSGSGTQVLSVVATGSSLVYSWRKAGLPVVNGGVITGQGTASLTLTNPTTADAGNYDVVITGACSSTVTSTAVAVTVNALPTITTTGIIASQCFNGVIQTTSLAYTATTNSPTSYSIDWNAAANTAGLVDQGNTAYVFLAGGGTFNTINVTAGTPAGSYSGVMTISNGNSCTTTQAVSIVINPIPTLTGATQSAIVCESSIATINLTGLLPNSTSTINYTINGVAQTAVTGILANGIGSGSFDTRVLTFADNSITLQVTGITVTSATPSCTKSFTQNVALSVKQDSGSISLNGIQYASNGSSIYCASNTAIFSIASVPGASIYTWTIPTGWSIISGQGTLELTVTTGTSVQSGTVSVTADILGCPSFLGVTLSTIPPVAPIFTKTDATCAVPSGKITVTSPAPAVGTIYTVTGTSPVVTAVTNTTGVFAGLAPGNYVVTSQVGSGCVSTPTTAITIIGLVTNTWTGSWSTGFAPTSSENVVFNSAYNLTTALSPLNACVCEVNAPVLVKDSAILKIQNELNVQGSGTLTFENNASLVQVNDNAVNTGVIKYTRTTSPVENFDYVYWSSPVANQVLNLFSPASDKYYSYEGGAWVAQNGNNNMNPSGKGFIIRVPKLYTNTPQTFEFNGVPNNGVISVGTDGVKHNLIGNPYPSAVDADAFINDSRNKLNITSALYFWTHNTKRTVVGSKAVYTSNDYATYNLTGGTGLPTGAAISGGTIPSGQIAAGQAFFVAAPAGSLYFDNSMRISTTGGNSQFFKQSSSKNETKIEKNRLWLNLTNDGGAFKQLLVGYVTGATNDFDVLYDGISINGNAFVDFYSVNDSKNFTIQGRGLPFVKNDEVPLGYNTSIAGTFQINIDNVDGNLVNQDIYLEDKITNIYHNLKVEPYSFTTEIGTFKDRFVLRYTDASKLGTDANKVKRKGVIVSVKNHQIKINAFDQTISSIKLYDLKGSLVYQKDKIGKNEFIINHLLSSNQFLIVMTQLEDGKWSTDEIIFQD